MRRVMSVLATCAIVAAGCGSGGGTHAATLVDIGQRLKGPSGLKATAYATGLTHVAAMAFDDAARLWVATADYSDAGHDALYVVSQAGAAPIKVVDGLHTPLGLLWYEQSLYLTSKEKVDAYSGFD